MLLATSGGIDVDAFGAEDWRTAYAAEFPNATSWIIEQKVDYTPQLVRVGAPTLLLWGDQDPISPTGVGRRLAGRSLTASSG